LKTFEKGTEELRVLGIWLEGEPFDGVPSEVITFFTEAPANETVSPVK
jgi:hypothetical protein